MFSLVYYVGWIFLGLGPWLPVPMAALLAAVVLGVEAWLGLMWLGRLFAKFDLSAESGA